MTDLHLNHISARVPGKDEHFLINPFGMMYEEITASSLIKSISPARSSPTPIPSSASTCRAM